jgi:hypothetical protein
MNEALVGGDAVTGGGAIRHAPAQLTGATRSDACAPSGMPDRIRLSLHVALLRRGGLG